MREGLSYRLGQALKLASLAGQFILAFALIMLLLLVMAGALAGTVAVFAWWRQLPLPMLLLSIGVGIALIGAARVTFVDSADKEKAKRGVDESEAKGE